MADRPAKKPGRKSRSSKKPSPSQELMQLLGRIAANHPAARLEVDLARDAALEAFHRLHQDLTKLSHFVRRLYRARKQRREVQNRLVRVLHELATSPVSFPRGDGQPQVEQEQLLAAYRQLRGHDMPEMARSLQGAIGRKEAATYQRFLVQEVLVKSGWAIAEHLLRHSHEPFDAEREREFLGRLRHHVAGRVCQGLERKAGYQVSPEVGKQLDTLISRAISFLEHVLLATPEVRLIVPTDGASFDPERHEAIAGRPHEGKLRVRATLFPGYALYGPEGRVVEKALVVTGRPRAAAVPS